MRQDHIHTHLNTVYTPYTYTYKICTIYIHTSPPALNGAAFEGNMHLVGEAGGKSFACSDPQHMLHQVLATHHLRDRVLHLVSVWAELPMCIDLDIIHSIMHHYPNMPY